MRTEDQVAAMQCPVCRVPLAMSDRQGIEIDYCPQCRGVWLDRGELDKIIERSAPQAAQPQRKAPTYAQHGGQSHSGYGHGASGSYGKPHKRKKSFFEELFD
ncbi:zf-TFIIB domain-containing protein [Parerythrobacter lacustris]|uniref:Zf-TFIIB domain-containing protein n=1 Tax=Parerythrobacter lacustris TaxID=2969984 RepID=A0ABT1XLP9_9SPHN|nr:zf-TFIIB domain-containing protein [Parerythrobacter lacustris]MCR2832586.1 zf-TFIIB domain-containing protein [Parerythrobacter lacustris]